jgi:GNAT superfamily N-acetyltransferase
MEGNLTLTQTFFTHTSDNGLIYDARPMPEEYLNVHQSILHNTNSGIAVRLYIIDPNETRKFANKENDPGVYLSENGEQGYIGYYDYNLEEDGSVTTRLVYIHPQHRGRNISKNLFNFIESIAEEGTIYNNHYIPNESLVKAIEDVLANKKVKLTYTDKDLVQHTPESLL